MADDRSHFVLCDWNLYEDDRPDPELCNLGCADQADAVAENWKQADLGYPNLGGSGPSAQAGDAT